MDMENLQNEIKVSNEIRSKVLIDALPYIQRYNGKIVVVKYGGNAMTNEELKNAVMSDIVLLSLVGVKVVLVHGGGPERSLFPTLHSTRAVLSGFAELTVR